MESVGQNDEQILQQRQEIALVERSSHFGATNVIEELHKNGQTSLGDISHRVFEGPDDRIDNQLENLSRHHEERYKSVIKSTFYNTIQL